MPKQETTVHFSEIFQFAEKEYKISWNECCDIFHRNAILVNDEGKDKNINLSDMEASLTDSLEKPNKYFTKEDQIGYPIVIAFMKKHKIKEMRVLND